ncbi:hypothetical protein JX265_012534 [Neoarthrinium moseri]|uniref:Uncharacterized protein n=1 Tax=Neoarthrinium moseri TaxID=1658444 RepID=A0A9P9W9X4_9PEZI|nr:hypothetical protein JX265_012837 [Neoarthrinium moseri]KAI1854365.1 hypothetical protein JX265_012534 [Neoarthrinium moseri]
MDAQPRASQASSHFPLDPISGSTLFDLETARRQGLTRRGLFGTGSKEIDEQVLVGGFERGQVVGVSAEEVDFALLLALQTTARNLVLGLDGGPGLHKAAIITTLAAPVILPLLRDVVKSQVQAKLGRDHASVNAHVRECLRRISVSRVFDIEGLWEVLDELETESPAPSPETAKEDVIPVVAEVPESSPLSSPLSSPPSSPIEEGAACRATERTEVLDSEDEGGLSSSPSASPVPTAGTNADVQSAQVPAPSPSNQEPEGMYSTIPEIILITHFSDLLSSLFTQRDKSSAHSTLQVLASHLRYLAHSAGPLIFLLNGTTNTSTGPVASQVGTGPTTPGQAGKRPPERPIDPTLRSIFNPPPPTHGGYGSSSLTLSRRNKPAFGLTFSQFLDLHLLCTRLPRARADAEAAFAPTVSHVNGTNRVKYAWAVEVLLDESRVWDGGGMRVDREQRWGAVDVNNGVKIVDAFQKEEKHYLTEPIRLAAGFGGRRV